MLEIFNRLNRLKLWKIKIPVYTRPLLPRVSKLPEINKDNMMYSLYGDCKHCEAMEKKRRAIDKWER